MGVFKKSDPRYLGSKLFFTQIPGSPPFWEVLKLFGQNRTLVEMWKKNGFTSYHIFKNDGFLKNMVAIFFKLLKKMHKNDLWLPKIILLF